MKKIIFLISILINIWFISQAAIYYYQVNYTEKKDHAFPFFSERRTSSFSIFPVLPESVVFLGDSITDEGRWAEIFPELVVRNRGVSADQTEHVLKRLSQVTKAQPEKIFLMIGTNDLNMGATTEMVVANIGLILKSIKDESPNSRVYVQSILPRGSDFQERIEHLNQALVMLTQEMGCTFIDLYSSFLDDDGSIKDAYSNDELHLVGAGYQKWKELIAPHLVAKKN